MSSIQISMVQTNDRFLPHCGSSAQSSKRTCYSAPPTTESALANGHLILIETEARRRGLAPATCASSDKINRPAAAFFVVLAIVLLAIAGLVTMAHAKQPNNFGLPPDIAAKVKAECAKVFPFYDTQITCEDDARAYKKLHGED
jgi:hypothetical protein